MKKFYKLLVFVLVAAMMLTTLAGCSSEPAASTPADAAPADSAAGDAAEGDAAGDSMAAEIFASVEPFAETQTLNLGLLSGGMNGFTNILIERLGGYEYANIDVNFEVFGNGPVVVETLVADAVDAAIYGVGGIHSGAITHGIVNLAPAMSDVGGLGIFAANDTAIVQAGMDEETGIYGTAEMWQEVEIFCNVGTSLYYTLSKGLDRVGLTLDDVQVTHMTPENVNTAMLAGQADVGAIWGALSYGDVTENNTMVINAMDVGVNLINNFVATETALADPGKAEAIQKWMEMFYVAVEWMYANDENFDQGIAWFQQWQEDSGIRSTPEDLALLARESYAFNLDQAYEMVSTESPTAGMTNFVYASYDPLEFYVSLGSFTEADLETFAQPHLWDTSMVEAIYEKYNA